MIADRQPLIGRVAPEKHRAHDVQGVLRQRPDDSSKYMSGLVRSTVSRVLSSRTLEPSSSGCMPLSRNSRCERKRVSQWNSPSGPPAEAPMSPWLSSTMKVSSCLSDAARSRRRARRRNVERSLGNRVERQYRRAPRSRSPCNACQFMPSSSSGCSLDRSDGPTGAVSLDRRSRRRPLEQRTVQRERSPWPCGWRKIVLESPAHRAPVEGEDLAATLPIASSIVSTITPVTPWSMISGTEPQRKASTGVPQAMASIIDSPNGSGQSIGNSSARASPRNSLLARSLISPM